MAKASRKAFVEGSVRPVWFAPVALLLVFVAVGAAFVGNSALGKDPPETAMGYGGLGVAAAAAVLLVVLVMTTRRELRVDLDGVKMRSGSGGPVHIGWDEEHDYYYLAVTGSSTPAVEKARVQTPDGRRIDVDDVKLPDYPNANVPALVERYSTAANLPKIKERLEEGEEVAFGALTVTGDTMEIEDHSVSTDGMVLNIEEGCVRVGTDGDWIDTKVSVHDVANYPSLLRLIGQITHKRSPT